MLSFFKNNRASAVFALLVYCFLVRLPAIFGLVAAPASSQRTGIWGNGWLWDFFAEQPVFSVVAAGILVFFQALLLNNLDSRHRIGADRTFVPAAMYVLLTAMFSETVFLSPILVSLTFVPLALDKIFKCYKQVKAPDLIFDAGFWMGVAGLFFPAASLLLIAVYFGILSLKTFNLRENLILFVGWFIPLFLVWTGCFWLGTTDDFWQHQFQNVISLPSLPSEANLFFWIKFGFLGLLILVALINYNFYFSKKLIHVQKFVGVFYWFLVVGLVIFAFSGRLDFHHSMLLLPQLAMFFGMNFSGGKNVVWQEGLHLLLLAAVIFCQIQNS